MFTIKNGDVDNAIVLTANANANGIVIKEDDLQKAYDYHINSFDLPIFIDHNSFYDKELVAELVRSGAGLVINDELIGDKDYLNRLKLIHKHVTKQTSRIINFAAKKADNFEHFQHLVELFGVPEERFNRRGQYAKSALEMSDAVVINSVTEASDPRQIIKAPTGTGKTRDKVRPAIEQAIAAGETVVYMTVSRALVESMNVEGLVDYRELRPGVEYKAIKTCIHSIHKPVIAEILERADVVVIDEAAQCLRNILTGDVRNREKVWNVFQKYVANSGKRLIAVDADFNDMLAGQLSGCTRYETKANIYSGIQVDVVEPEIAFKSVIEAKSALVATDSKRTAKRLQAALKGRKVLTITGDTVLGEEQAAFIRDTSRASLYDFIIYTPAIGSGVSINESFFSLNVGIFNGSVLPSDAVQMIRRDRSASRVLMGIGDKPHKAKAVTFGSSDLDQAIRKCLESENQLKSFFRASLIDTLTHLGFNVHIVSNEKDQVKEAKSLVRAASKVQKLDYNESVMNAEFASDAEYAEYQASGRLSSEDQFFRIERRRVEEYCRDVSVETLKDWSQGALAVHLDNWKLANQTFSTDMIAQIERKNLGLSALDRNRDHIKSACLKVLVELITSEDGFDNNSAQIAIKKMLKAGWSDSGFVEIVETKQATRLIGRLSRELFGIRIEAKKVMVDGKRVNRYFAKDADVQLLAKYFVSDDEYIVVNNDVSFKGGEIELAELDI
jgi:hypothetical protein